MPHNQSVVPAYGVTVAARLRELRQGRGWSMRELQARLETAGRRVPVATLYAYERGRSAGGVDLPLELIPLVAAVFDCPGPGDWLPSLPR